MERTTHSTRPTSYSWQHPTQVTLNITQIVVSGLDHFDTHPDLMYAPAYTSLKRPGSSHSDARTNARTTSIRGVHNHICTFNTSTRTRAHGRGAHIVATRVCCAAAATHIIYLRRDCPTAAPRLPRSLIGIWPAATRLARRSHFGTPSPRSTCGSRSSRRDRPSRTTYDRGKRNACVCVRVCVDVPVRALD